MPKIGVFGLINLSLALGKLERLAQKIPLDDPMQAPDARVLDAQTLADYLEQNVRGRRARDMITLATQMIFAAEPRELSLLYFCLRALGEGLQRLCEITAARRSAGSRRARSRSPSASRIGSAPRGSASRTRARAVSKTAVASPFTPRRVRSRRAARSSPSRPRCSARSRSRRTSSTARTLLHADADGLDHQVHRLVRPPVLAREPDTRAKRSRRTASCARRSMTARLPAITPRSSRSSSAIARRS
jgi:hypothetical protein